MSANNSQSVQSGGKQHVLVNVILDKSGSMSTKVQDVIGGFNLYLDELAKERAVDYGFSLTLFDTAVLMKYKAVPLAKVAKLDDTTYCPSGNTALFDAIWPLTDGRRVRKRRHVVPDYGLQWEIDEYLDRDLVLLEVAPESDAGGFALPDWLESYVVREVTGEHDFTARALAR